MSSPNKAVNNFKFPYIYKKCGLHASAYPTPRSRITSLVRTSNANTHTEYDLFCHTIYEKRCHSPESYPKWCHSCLLLTVEIDLSATYFQVANLGVKISVVTPISIYAFCLSIQTVVQSATAKVRKKSQISFSLL